MTIYDWRPWFAWHPVNINGKWHWLKTVQRRTSYYYGLDELRPYMHLLMAMER